MAFWDNVESAKHILPLDCKKNGSFRDNCFQHEKNRTEPRASDAFKIVSALGTTVEYLCNGESDYYQSRYINLKNAIKEILEKY